MTYARYLSTAQQVYLAALNNLHEVAVAEQSVSAIDDDYIAQRLDELAHQDDKAATAERGSLEDRRSLLASQEKKISNLLAQNESAMTVLDRTATALADAPIGRQPQDAEVAMAALQEMADRAGKYAT
jgi:cell division protein ZapA (FtsZ GTPase activity inhibitor)